MRGITLRVVDLKGTWEAERVGHDLAVLARVPGQVQLDLMRAGAIEDPHAGRNEEACLWVGQSDWEYRRTFEVDAKLLAEREIVLVCEGLDTVATVKVNGVEVGRADNMFRRYVFRLKGPKLEDPELKDPEDEGKNVLREGENEIAVRFRSPVAYAAEKAGGHAYTVPYAEQYKGLKTHRNFVRKSGTHFGWDWGPCLLPLGIWRPIRLEAYSEARIRHVTTGQTHLGETPSSGGGAVDLDVSVFLDSPGDVKGKIEVALALTLPGRRATVAASDSREVSLARGENRVGFTLRVAKPEFWWPSGYGEQRLYGLLVTFVGEKGETDRVRKRIGLRKLDLVRERDADGDTLRPGESFAFRVNGVPVYAKGANWIPADSFDARVTRERLQNLLGSAREANMNMLRVWGGGVYESEAFYDLCDEMGIMVWQDFMFACALYPADDEFLSNVRAEARHQVRRLSSHPCIALWCGNNENEQALRWHGEARERRDRYVVDYSRLYVDTIGKVVRDEDPTRAFWPSSPSNGVQEWGDPNDLSRGDCHFWGVWHGGKPYAEYLKIRPRFSSEFGFQSFPSMESLAKVVAPEAMNVSSPMMEHRQRSGAGNARILEHVLRHFRMPKDFESFVYVSQVLQAVSMKTAVEHWRRIKPYCSGALYWQLNDIWEGPTWSSLEYDGRWKLLHHFARRFFAPVLVSAVEEEDGAFAVWITSDLREELKGELRIALLTWRGELVGKWSASFDVPELESGPVWHGVLEDMLAGRDREQCFVRLSAGVWERPGSGGSGRGPKSKAKARLKNKAKKPAARASETQRLTQKVRAEGLHCLAPMKRADLARPEIKVKVSGRREREAKVRLETDSPAPFVFLSSRDILGRFDDNGFLLLPGEPREVRFTGWQDFDQDEFRSKLKVRSLRDTY